MANDKKKKKKSSSRYQDDDDDASVKSEDTSRTQKWHSKSSDRSSSGKSRKSKDGKSKHSSKKSKKKHKSGLGSIKDDEDETFYSGADISVAAGKLYFNADGRPGQDLANGFSFAADGQPGGNLTVELSTIVANQNLCAQIKARASSGLQVVVGEDQESAPPDEEKDYTVELSQLRTIEWSARGGKNGTGGKPGKGGNVRFSFYERDSYLAMVIAGSRAEMGFGNRLSAGGVETNGSNGAGDCGKFELAVIDEEDGATTTYSSRYDLTLVGVKEKHNSRLEFAEDGSATYEFGETILFSKIDIKNVGEMPSPRQRVRIGMDATVCENLIIHAKENIFLRDSIRPGETIRADLGSIRFTLALPDMTDMGEDFDPISAEGRIGFEAFQLGPEKHPDKPKAKSAFEKEYTSFDLSGGVKLTLAFPIENRDGVLGLRTMAWGEKSKLKFSVFNVSGKGIGRKSKSERRLYVEYYLIADKLRYQISGSEVIVCNTQYGTIVSVDPKEHGEGGFKGHSFQIKRINDDEEFTIEHTIQLLPSAPLFGRGALQVSIYLQGVPKPQIDGSSADSEEVNLVQRRLHEFYCHPSFIPNPAAKVVLVTTTSTTQEQYFAWKQLLSERLYMPAETYSIDLYGHLTSWREISFLERENESSSRKSETLRNLFAGKLIIVLNEKFGPLPREYEKVEIRPSELLSTLSGFDVSTRWLVVGGDSDSIAHLSSSATNDMLPSFRKWELSNEAENEVEFCTDDADNPDEPTAELSSAVESYESSTKFKKTVTDYLKRERDNGPDTRPVLPAFSTIGVVCKVKGAPTPQKALDILMSHAAELQTWLQKNDVVREYAIEIRPGKVKETDAGWEIGSLVVFCGHPRATNIINIITGDDVFANVDIIKSRTVMYSVLAAAPTSVKTLSYCAALSKLPDKGAEEVCHIHRDVMVCDFFWDTLQYYDGRIRTGDVKSRSITLRALMDCSILDKLIKQAQTNPNLLKVMRVNLCDLYARLESVADSKDFRPWWAPLSRKHAVRMDLLEAVRCLTDRWKGILDTQTIKTNRGQVDQSIQEYIKGRGKTMVAANKRWKAAIGYIHSPMNVAAYPTPPGSGPKGVQLLREAELRYEREELRIKKCVPVTVDPEKANSIFAKFSNRNVFIDFVYSSIAGKRNEFVTT